MELSIDLTIAIYHFRFHFPQILVPINAGILSIVRKFLNGTGNLSITLTNFVVFLYIDIVILISTVSGAVGRWDVLCSKKFLFDALDNPTPFCTVQG